VTGALTESAGHLLNHGLLHLLTSWVPYALLVAAVSGIVLNQSAFQAGELHWSLPVTTILEPLVAIAIGELMFNEHIASTAVGRAGEFLGLVGMAVGVVVLTHTNKLGRAPAATAVGRARSEPR
jgi:hypothetical protein